MGWEKVAVWITTTAAANVWHHSSRALRVFCVRCGEINVEMNRTNLKMAFGLGLLIGSRREKTRSLY
jgi:hypothetical protein